MSQAVEMLYLAFVLLAGLTMGGLGLLAIGHLMSEEWLDPIREEAEAAALTAPLLALLALPLAFHLSEIYPWAGGDRPRMPALRAAYLSPGFFLLRSAGYLAILVALAAYVTRAREPRRAGAIGLGLLAPTATFAANDWVLSRDPQWWSSLFGFSFALSQLLAALAGGIMVALLRPKHPSPARMQSLERALLTLCLLVLWCWFVQFLIVWFGNLPGEAAWYLARSGGLELRLLTLVALPALLAAILVLAPPGFGRRTMVAGSALVLVGHGAHMLWIIDPEGPGPEPWAVAAALGPLAAWGLWFALVLRSRPGPPEEGTAQGAPPVSPAIGGPRAGSTGAPRLDHSRGGSEG